MDYLLFILFALALLFLWGEFGVLITGVASVIYAIWIVSGFFAGRYESYAFYIGAVVCVLLGFWLLGRALRDFSSHFKFEKQFDLTRKFGLLASLIGLGFSLWNGTPNDIVHLVLSSVFLTLVFAYKKDAI